MSDLAEDLKYVIVEMIENNQEKAVSRSIRSGLLKGIKPHKHTVKDKEKNDVLIVLSSKENVLYLLNLSYFNILSIKKSDGASKIATYFRANEDDQSKAFSIIADIVLGMHAAERTDKNDCNLINLETYTDLPDDFTTIKADDDTSTVSKSSTYNPTGNRNIGARSTVNRSAVVEKDEVKPQFFKRGSKKPSEDALKEMDKRIKEIASGKLEIKLPVIVGDDKEVEVIDPDDYDASYMYAG